MNSISLAEWVAGLRLAADDNVSFGFRTSFHDAGRSVTVEPNSRVCAVSVGLGAGARDYLVPSTFIGSSTGLPSDVVGALLTLDTQRRTIMRAMAVYAAVQHSRVYFGDVPCHFCGGTGRNACKHCDGTGVRVKAGAQ